MLKYNEMTCHSEALQQFVYSLVVTSNYCSYLYWLFKIDVNLKMVQFGPKHVVLLNKNRI